MDSNQNHFCRLPLAPDEKENIKQPPRMHEITWRIFRIMAEFVEGFQFLSESAREITFFGSARFKSSDRWYKEAEKLGRLLAKYGFTVITGGGPGIMEAGNKGAYKTGGTSLGINIQLPSEQRANAFITRGRGFHYFFVRKVILAASAQAYVFFPGGFGTLDEFFEIIMLIQTGKMQPLPIVCVGKEFWGGLSKWMEKTLRDTYKTIAASDLKLFTIVDTAEEAFETISKSEERTFF